LNNKIPAKILVRIEDELLRAGDPKNISYARLSTLMHEGVGCDELAKAIDLSWRMPICEIAEHIFQYDNSSPKMDEIKFITGLGSIYRVPHDEVVFRIQGVRKVQDYLDDRSENLYQYKKQKNKEHYITKRVDFTVSIAVARAMLVGYGYLQRVVDDMSDDEVVLAVLGRTSQYGAEFKVVEEN
jgi:hypothetical protein